MWLDIPRPDYPTLSGGLTCDLLVVGGGYAGLWSALHAKERHPGARVVLIEAEQVGWAASGRNGGFVEASITHGAENGKSRWPTEFDRLEKLGLANLDGMQADIESYGMNVDWERTGMLTVATEPHQVEWLAEGADDGEGRFLDEAAVRDEVASPTYRAGLWATDTCAIVHPARLVFELARACAEAGVEIFEHTAALSVHRERRGIRVETRAGTIEADQIVLATNVFPSLLKRNRLHTIPVYDYVLATEPLTSEQLDRIGWRSRQGIGDSGNQFHYYRLSADNRIVWGGYDAVYHYGRRVDPMYEDRPETYRKLAAHFFITFPQLEDVRFSHRWAGAIDTNTRFCAHWGWPAAAGSRTSTDSPVWAWVRPGSPPTSAWICSTVTPPSGPSWRWSTASRCRSRPNRWPASVFRRPGGRWIGPTTTRANAISSCALSIDWDWVSIPEPN